MKVHIGLFGNRLEGLRGLRGQTSFQTRALKEPGCSYELLQGIQIEIQAVEVRGGGCESRAESLFLKDLSGCCMIEKYIVRAP